MNPGAEIRTLAPEDWPVAVALAAASGLPTDDLAPGRQHLWGAFFGPELAGVIGAEVFGSTALVRTMAVAPSHRGQGFAGALFRHLEAWWAARGDLVLLTETAEAFFARRGFQTVDRAGLPAAVQASAEFQGLCPVSARAMRRLARP